jgi:hypothetical protein
MGSEIKSLLEEVSQPFILDLLGKIKPSEVTLLPPQQLLRVPLLVILLMEGDYRISLWLVKTMKFTSVEILRYYKAPRHPVLPLRDSSPPSMQQEKQKAKAPLVTSILLCTFSDLTSPMISRLAATSALRMAHVADKATTLPLDGIQQPV